MPMSKSNVGSRFYYLIYIHNELSELLLTYIQEVLQF